MVLEGGYGIGLLVSGFDVYCLTGASSSTRDTGVFFILPRILAQNNRGTCGFPVLLHMSLRRARASEKLVEWVRAKFAPSRNLHHQNVLGIASGSYDTAPGLFYLSTDIDGLEPMCSMHDR